MECDNLTAKKKVKKPWILQSILKSGLHGKTRKNTEFHGNSQTRFSFQYQEIWVSLYECNGMAHTLHMKSANGRHLERQWFLISSTGRICLNFNITMSVCMICNHDEKLNTIPFYVACPVCPKMHAKSLVFANTGFHRPNQMVTKRRCDKKDTSVCGRRPSR